MIQDNDLDTVGEELIENTKATVVNTQATLATSGTSGISRTTAIVTGLLLAATCYVSYINPTFAENQAGIIFSAIGGGLFGVTMKR